MNILKSISRGLGQKGGQSSKAGEQVLPTHSVLKKCLSPALLCQGSRSEREQVSIIKETYFSKILRKIKLTPILIPSLA